MSHPWISKFRQCIPSLASACENLHVKFDHERAEELASQENWRELENMLLELGGALAKRNSKYAKSLDTLVWALYQVFPFKTER